MPNTELTARADIRGITEGDDEDFPFTFIDGGGNPIDITGWTVSSTVKERGDDTVLISKDVTDHDDAANGETSFTWTASDTSGITGHKRYDIQVKRDDGTIKTIVAGTVEFRDGVTDRSV